MSKISFAAPPCLVRIGPPSSKPRGWNTLEGKTATGLTFVKDAPKEGCSRSSGPGDFLMRWYGSAQWDDRGYQLSNF